MVAMLLRRICLLCFGLVFSLPAFGMWKTLKTDAFTVFYPRGREQEAGEILEVLEYYRDYAGDLVGAPRRRVAVVLEDAGLESNGLTDVAFHRILLFRASPSRGALSYHQKWWRLVGIHEYTHWRHLSAAERLPAFLTVLFGNTMAPGNYTPGWLKEGVCVVAESGTSPVEGRLNEGLFDAYAAILARSGGLPTVVQATYNMDVFPGGTGPYLFGGQFVEFLLHKYGRQQLARFFRHFSASILSYLSPALPAAGLDRSARAVFGESIRSLWMEWQVELMAGSVSFTPAEPALTRHGWWLDSPVVWSGGIIYQRSFPVKPSVFSTRWHHQIVHLEPQSGRTRVLHRSSAAYTGPMRIRSGKLFYALQEIEEGYDNHLLDRFGITSVLYSRDLETGRTRKLLMDPFRTFEVLSDNTILLAGDRRAGFGSEIRLYDPLSGESRRLLESDTRIFDIAADSDGLFVAARRDWENIRIYRAEISGWNGSGWELLDADLAGIRLEPLHDTPYQEAELCLAGDRLFYSATYGAGRTLYEYDLESDSVRRSVSSDYARAPAWDEQSGMLYYIGMNPGGEDLYREKPLDREYDVPARAEALSTPIAPGLPPVPGEDELYIPEPSIRHGGYWDNLATLVPRIVFPYLSVDLYSRTFQAGAGLAGTSALGDWSYMLLAYYDSVDTNPELEIQLDTALLAPVFTSFGFSTANDSRFNQLIELSASAEWPLYRSLRSGLSYLSFGISGFLEWDESREQSETVIPYMVLALQAAASQAYFQAGLQNRFDDAGAAHLLLPGLYASAILLGAELAVQAAGLYDLLDLYLWTFPWAPPGYLTALEGVWGAYLFSSLSLPLFRLRGGTWNPGLYFGDMFLVPFFSLAFNQDRDLQLSYGGTLHLELKTGARDEGFALDLYAGLGGTLEGEGFLLLGVEVPAYGGAYLQMRQEAARGKPLHPVSR